MFHLSRVGLVALLGCAALVLGIARAGAVAQGGSTVTVTVNTADSALGAGFDGMATISAGAEGRLIRDYPASELPTIFDYMFCSARVASSDSTKYCLNNQYGAGPAIFKVEVGGDENSSAGAEPSFLRTTTEYSNFVSAVEGGTIDQVKADCGLPTTDTPGPGLSYWGRGYEWRLMREAEFRDPQIAFSALAWGAPGYIGGGGGGVAGDFFANEGDALWPTGTLHPDMLHYYLYFAYCAYLNGTPITYVGGQNESAVSDYSWFHSLATDISGFTDPQNNSSLVASIKKIKIVATDNYYSNIVPQMYSTQSLQSDIYAIGTHYGGDGDACPHGYILGNCTATFPYSVCPTLSTSCFGNDNSDADDTTGNDTDADGDGGAAGNAYGYLAGAWHFQGLSGVNTHLWASEEGELEAWPTLATGQPDPLAGAGGYAQVLNNYYILARNTSVQMVSALGSYYDDSNFAPNGMVTANAPWSGNYTEEPAVWVMGHYGQFTEGPNVSVSPVSYRWKYIPSASCVKGEHTNLNLDLQSQVNFSSQCADGSTPSSGTSYSYTTLAQTVSGTRNWSSIIETTEAATQTGSGTQTFDFCPVNSAAVPDPAYLWDTNLNTGAPTNNFASTAVHPTSGLCNGGTASGYTFTAQPNHVYTLTSLRDITSSINAPTSNSAATLQFGEIDGNFDNGGFDPGRTYAIGETPKYFADQMGAFVIGEDSPPGANLLYLSQVVTTRPIFWGDHTATPSTIIGDHAGEWCSSYSGVVAGSVDVRIDGAQDDGTAGWAEFELDSGGDVNSGFGIRLTAGTSPKIQLFIPGDSNSPYTQTLGSLSSGWHTLDLSLNFTGSQVVAKLDGTTEFTEAVPSGSAQCGFASFDTGWNRADFDNFSLRSTA